MLTTSTARARQKVTDPKAIHGNSGQRFTQYPQATMHTCTVHEQPLAGQLPLREMEGMAMADAVATFAYGQ